VLTLWLCGGFKTLLFLFGIPTSLAWFKQWLEFGAGLSVYPTNGRLVLKTSIIFANPFGAVEMMHFTFHFWLIRIAFTV